MIKNLQSLRGIAAILIFYHHFMPYSATTMSFGDLGVTFFMMLSGFVMSLSYSAKNHDTCSARREIKRLITGRIIKIYPLYLLTWVLAYFALPYHGSVFGYLTGTLMMQSWSTDPAVYFAGNAVAWFISDLMFCYLIFIPLYRMLERWHRIAAATLALYFTAYFLTVNSVSAELEHAVIYINPCMQLSSFIIGMLLHGICVRLQRPVSRATATVAEIATLSAVVAAILFYNDIPQRYAFAAYWWPVCAVTILVAVLTDIRPGLTGKLLHSRTLLWLGDISFSFYLIHYIAISLWHRIPQRASADMSAPWLLMQSVILLALTALAAHFMAKHFEKPVYKRLRRLIDKRA